MQKNVRRGTEKKAEKKANRRQNGGRKGVEKASGGKGDVQAAEETYQSNGRRCSQNGGLVLPCDIYM